MNLAAGRRAVRRAQAEAAASRAAFRQPAHRLATRVAAHPWLTWGSLAGLGFLLGRLRAPRPRAANPLPWSGLIELAAMLLRLAPAARATGEAPVPAPANPGPDASAPRAPRTAGSPSRDDAPCG